MIIADSDVLIDFLRGAELAQKVGDLISSGNLKTTAISVFELESGARTAPQQKLVNDLLAGIEIFPIDPESAKKAGELHRILLRKGVTVPTADSLIAGVCLKHKAELLTRNKRHFQNFKGLRFAT